VIALPAGLPLVTAAGSRAQRKGKACASCRKRRPRPEVPAAVTLHGELLLTCPECVLVLEPVPLIQGNAA
jgi:hypothetical protein